MISSNIPMHSRQYSVRIPDEVSGGPDRAYSSLLVRLDLLRGTAIERVDAAIKRLEKQRSAEAYSVVYLDGLEVRDGAPYLVVRAHFHLRAKFQVIRGMAS